MQIFLEAPSQIQCTRPYIILGIFNLFKNKLHFDRKSETFEYIFSDKAYIPNQRDKQTIPGLEQGFWGGFNAECTLTKLSLSICDQVQPNN